MKIRIPTDAEYQKLCEVTAERDCLMHWRDINCWVDDGGNPLPFDHNRRKATRGCLFSAYDWDSFLSFTRLDILGFRPAVEGLDTDALVPDDNGAVVLGTLYMEDVPVKVPKDPTYRGDIVNYIHGAKLELREPLDDPDYQVKGFVVGEGVAIVDRALLKYISYWDIEHHKEEEK